MVDQPFDVLFRACLAKANWTREQLAIKWVEKRGGVQTITTIDGGETVASINAGLIAEFERGACECVPLNDAVLLFKVLTRRAFKSQPGETPEQRTARRTAGPEAYRSLLRAFVGSFSRRFAACRKSSGLSQDELATMCKEAAARSGSATGLQASRISEIENGRTDWLGFDDALLLINTLAGKTGAARPSQPVGGSVGRSLRPFSPISEPQSRGLLDAFIGEKTRVFVDQVRAFSCHGIDDEVIARAGQEQAVRSVVAQVNAVQPLLSARDVLASQAGDQERRNIYSGIAGRSEVSNNKVCASKLLAAAVARPQGCEYVLLVSADERGLLVASLRSALTRFQGDRAAARAKVRIVVRDVTKGLPDFVGQTTIIEELPHGAVRVLSRLRLAGSMDGPVFSVLPVSPKLESLFEAFRSFARTPGDTNRTLGEWIDADAALTPAITAPDLSPRLDDATLASMLVPTGVFKKQSASASAGIKPAGTRKPIKPEVVIKSAAKRPLGKQKLHKAKPVKND